MREVDTLSSDIFLLLAEIYSSSTVRHTDTFVFRIILKRARNLMVLNYNLIIQLTVSA